MPNIIVNKSNNKNIAYLFYKNKKIKCFVGKNGIGIKQKEGDYVTPKGVDSSIIDEEKTKRKLIEKEKIILKKPTDSSKNFDDQPSYVNGLEEKNEIKSYEVEADNDSEGAQESFVEKKVVDEKIANEQKTDDNKLAFFDLQRPKKKLEKRSKKNNYVGLLLPLTGDKRAAGSLVLNTFRYSLVKKPKDIVFKIYDTKGTVEGVIDAAIKGKNDDVEIFVGPIFSYETKALKQKFSNDDSVVFFSLSPDLSNISDNIIVSGQNSEDQVACIVSNLKLKEINDLLLIHHDDKYGEIIKQSVQKNLIYHNLQNINLSLFEIDKNKDLNKEIKSISQFERRKATLKAKISQISNDQKISKDEKKRLLKKLDRQLTIDSPFDAIIVASEGDKLLEILSHLAFYDINANNTLVYGTSLWEDTPKNDPVFENTFLLHL